LGESWVMPLVIVGYFVVQFWLLPRLGVPT
jgi:hypothetical protein